MTRIFRAAGVAAACAALSATATIAAPSVPAQNLSQASQSQTAGYSVAGLFRSALAALVGTSASAPAAAAVVAPVPPPTLAELIEKFETDATSDQAQDCLASAVYFESRGEPIEGQLAVANVVLNRAASGRYPPDV